MIPDTHHAPRITLAALPKLSTFMQAIFATIGKNTGVLFLVNVVGGVMGFLMAAALGRGLGETGFGQYSFVMTWLLSLMLLAEFGLSTVLTRDLAARPEDRPGYLINSLVGKALLGLPALLILLIFAPQIAPRQNLAVASALRWGIFFLYSGLAYSSFTAVFKAHQTMMPILWLTLAGQILLLAGTLVLLLQGQPLFMLVGWAGLSQSLQCFLAYLFYKGLPGEPTQPDATSNLSRRISGGLIKTLLASAWPFALAGFLAALQLRANILILGYLQGDQALGWYAAANRFIETGKQLPASFYSAILPAMAALAGAQSIAQNRALQRTFHHSRLGLLAFGLLASVGALLLAQPVLSLTYGSVYQPATPILQILTFTLIPASQNSLLIIYLYAVGDEKFVNLLTALGILVNLGLCFWLIPAWGPAGVALALLIAESMLYLPYRARVMSRQARVTS
jgi:O-antigen/teichoic acid export membrane protein